MTKSANVFVDGENFIASLFNRLAGQTLGLGQLQRHLWRVWTYSRLRFLYFQLFRSQKQKLWVRQALLVLVGWHGGCVVTNYIEWYILVSYIILRAGSYFLPNHYVSLTWACIVDFWPEVPYRTRAASNSEVHSVPHCGDPLCFRRLDSRSFCYAKADGLSAVAPHRRVFSERGVR